MLAVKLEELIYSQVFFSDRDYRYSLAKPVLITQNVKWECRTVGSSKHVCDDLQQNKANNNQNVQYSCNFLFLDVEYLINKYDGCERPKDLQSNFGIETIRTLSDEETWAWGGGWGVNELLSLCNITRDFPAVIDNHPIGPSPSFSLVHRRFCASDQE